MEASSGTKEQAPGKVGKAKSWAGYAWFMSFGTLLPLPIFLCGYAAHVTQVGAPLARQLYGFGIFLSTMGQKPPGADKIGSKADGDGKKPFAERVRDHSPPGWLERRGRPVPLLVRVVWFVLVGWWLGLFWVVLAWSVLLLPYPFPDLIRSLLADVPSVMTLAWPDRAGTSSAPTQGAQAPSA